MRALADPSQVRQCHRDTDCAVAAHAQVPDVVEEDHPGDAGWIDRRQQDRADHDIRPARLVDDRRAKCVVLLAKDGLTLGHRAGTQVRAAGEDDAGRLTAGMSVDHGNALHHVRYPFGANEAGSKSRGG